MNKQFCKYIYNCKARETKVCFEETPCQIKRFYDKYGTNYIRQTKTEPTREGATNAMDGLNHPFTRDKTADSNLEETLQPKVFKY